MTQRCRSGALFDKRCLVTHSTNRQDEYRDSHQAISLSSRPPICRETLRGSEAISSDASGNWLRICRILCWVTFETRTYAIRAYPGSSFVCERRSCCKGRLHTQEIRFAFGPELRSHRPVLPVFAVLRLEPIAEHLTCNLCSENCDWSFIQACLVPKMMIRHRILRAVGDFLRLCRPCHIQRRTTREGLAPVTYQ